MGLLFYASDTKGAGKLLWNLHQELAAEYRGEFFQTIDTLSQNLRQPQGDLSIAVLLASTQEEFKNILSIRDLLVDRVRIILILPDSNKDTISKGHALFPRYLAYVDGNFNWVIEVLKKMLSNNYGGIKRAS